jgi:outer membrane protein OmpA-like peptidoglycan-associated protein
MIMTLFVRSTLVLTLVIASTSLYGQRTEYGLMIGAAYNAHHAEFTQLGSYASCCPSFTGGSGVGPMAGLFVTAPLSTSPLPSWRVQGRLLYSVNSAVLTNDERSFVADLRDSARVVPALFRHELQATLTSVGIEPVIAFRPFAAFDVMVGGRVGMTLRSHFRQTETLVEPEDFGSYLGSGRTWVEHDTEIPDASTLTLGVVGGLRYVLPLNTDATLLLIPELTAHVQLTNVSTTAPWSMVQVRGGLGLVFSPKKRPEPVDTVDAVPTITTPPPPTVEPLTIAVGLYRRTPEGRRQIVDTVRVEETRVIDFLPVLGHVYFEVPERYRVASTVDLERLSDPVSASHSVLAVVAHRLKEHPTWTIELVGSTSGTDADGSLDLAWARAEAVQQTLISLGIDAERMSIKNRRLPIMPTMSSLPEERNLAEEENRRVEIIPSNPDLLQPLTLTSLRVSVDPPALFAATDVQGPIPVRHGATSIRLHDSVITSAPIVDSTVSTQLAPLLQYAEDGPSVLVADAAVTDTLSRTVVDTTIVPISRLTVERKQAERRADSEIERYSLILFAFDDARITREHERLLDRIRERMRQGATVRILGMTDSMGKSAYNLELSKRRAQSVAKSLGLPDTAIEAVGSSAPRFSNQLPDGRAYNRTVIIEVTSLRTSR